MEDISFDNISTIDKKSIMLMQNILRNPPIELDTLFHKSSKKSLLAQYTADHREETIRTVEYYKGAEEAAKQLVDSNK
jgi:hypothetical protein